MYLEESLFSDRPTVVQNVYKLNEEYSELKKENSGAPHTFLSTTTVRYVSKVFPVDRKSKDDHFK